jgi:hypothetical protein
MSFLSRSISAHTVSLTDDQLSRSVPSLFAEAPHESRSEKYAYIPTVDVLAALRKEGFQVVAARQTRVRDQGRVGYCKHMLRLRHADLAGMKLKLHDTFPEVVLINSHDGSSGYQLMAGMFRLVCLNGMVVSDGRSEMVKVPHKGDIRNRVIEGSWKVLQDSAAAVEQAAEWQGIMLNRDEMRDYAVAAHILRFGDSDGEVKTVIEPEQLLQPRRHADQGNDLWRTFNRVQENGIKGGLSARNPETRRRTTTREVTGIDGDVKFNKAIDHLTATFAKSRTTLDAERAAFEAEKARFQAEMEAMRRAAA